MQLLLTVNQLMLISERVISKRTVNVRTHTHFTQNAVENYCSILSRAACKSVFVANFFTYLLFSALSMRILFYYLY